MWWLAAAWAGWGAVVAVEDHGSAPVVWRVDDQGSAPPVTWTAADGTIRRALVTALYGVGEDQVLVELSVQSRRGRRWEDDTRPMLLFRPGADAVFGVQGADGADAWRVTAQVSRTDGPARLALAAWASDRGRAGRSLVVGPGLSCAGWEVVSDGPVHRATPPEVALVPGLDLRWPCEGADAPAEARLRVW